MARENWRFIDLDLIPLERLHGIEEAIARSKSKPTILLWRAQKPVITLGYFQKVEEELDLENCKKLRIPVVRRITGGGACLIGPEIVAYSVIVDEKNSGIPFGIEKSYEVICNGIVEALASLGLKAQFVPINDVQISNKKLSGSAQTRAWGKIIQHGFLNLNLDLKALVDVLNVPKEKFSDKSVKSLEERVTWINKETAACGKPDVSMSDLKKCLRSGFEKTLNIKLIDEKLTEAEVRKANIYTKKFTMDDWNYRPTLFKTANARSIYKAKKGVIRVSAYIEDNIIKDILVTGDFFIYPENKFLKFEESLINTPTDENSVRRIVNKFLNENKLTPIGITAEDFVTAISQAVSSR